MIQADQENIPVLFPVHDELDMIGPLQEALRLKWIMENCVKLCVPTIVKLSSGKSWGECK